MGPSTVNPEIGYVACMYADVRHRGAWLSWADGPAEDDEPAEDALIEWSNENCEAIDNRLVIVPTVSSSPGDGVVGMFAENAVVESVASRSLRRTGGPVVAAWPEVKMLDVAIGHAHGQTLIAIEGPMF